METDLGELKTLLKREAEKNERMETDLRELKNLLKENVKGNKSR